MAVQCREAGHVCRWSKEGVRGKLWSCKLATKGVDKSSTYTSWRWQRESHQGPSLWKQQRTNTLARTWTGVGKEKWRVISDKIRLVGVNQNRELRMAAGHCNKHLTLWCVI